MPTSPPGCTVRPLAGVGALVPIMWERAEREFTPQVLKALCELQYDGANFNQRNVLRMLPAFLSGSL